MVNPLHYYKSPSAPPFEESLLPATTPMAKRKAPPTSKAAAPTKRPRQDRPSVEFTDIKSIRELAKPYQLATARFPIDALTSTWHVGSNRPIDARHVQNLCRIFEEQGLQRELADNHLLIACSRLEVERMMDYLQKAKESAPALEGDLPLWPAFNDWMLVNGCKAEIIAGQHRVEALKVFLSRIGSCQSVPATAEAQSWWICDIYDRGWFLTTSLYPLFMLTALADQLPTQLSVRLRANRLGSTLPDSHGQIWMELVALANADHSLFRGNQGLVHNEMLQALHLSGQVKFPIRRLATLWKNTSWQPMITRWCRTAIGRATFNVSLWEEVARYRIDDVS